MVLKKGDTVVLGNKKIYQVIETVSYDGFDYCLITIPTKNKSEVFEKSLFVREKIKDDNLVVVPIEDKDLLDILGQLVLSKSNS